MNRLTRSSIGLGAVVALALLWGAAPAIAQETGTIAGTVEEAASGRALSGVQVYIPNQPFATLTQANGRFLLTRVPAGEHVVRVTLIGYGTREERVVVRAGQTAEVAFHLERSAIQLDEVVVSGAGVATERKRLGNTIASVNTQELEAAPVNSVSEMLAGREAGVSILPSSGSAGEGARIRIRGAASLSQSNEPIVYVDGVRVDRAGGFGPYVSAGGQAAPSRLDDIPPEAIERIEILKGAAAATLYGTEASAGVVQIFTKRGRESAPQWTAEYEQGFLSPNMSRIKPLADFAQDDPFTGETAQQQVDRIQEHWGMSVEPYEVFTVPVLNNFFETGLASSMSLSVSGGTNLITYFASGRYHRTDGPLAPEADIFQADAALPTSQDLNERRQATVNLSLFPHPDLRIRLSSLYSETTQRTPSNSNNIFGFWSSGLMGHPRYANDDNRFGTLAFATVEENARERIEQDAEHYTGVLGLHYQALDNVSLEATWGVDLVNQRDSDFFPFGWNVNNFSPFYTTGLRVIGDRNHKEVSGDLKLSWNANFGESLSSTFLAGAQGFITQTESSGGVGIDFPGPGLEVTGAAAEQEALETWLRVVNAGVYAQEQIGFNDFAFMTFGARYDANSAFGEAFEGVLYPKVSASIVPSDMRNWNNSMFSTLRVRAAVGQSGLQPGAFDKFTTFVPLAAAGGPGLAPGNLGNQNLKPEVATEWEVGAEMGMFSDRAAIELTYWDRTVRDALIPRQFPVSGGFRATQIDNIGELKASGFELGLNGAAVQTSNLTIDLFAGATYMEQKITDMGSAPPLKVGGAYPRYRQFVKEGYAPGAFFGARTRDVAIPLSLDKACLSNEDAAAPTEAEALAYFSQPRSPDEFEVLAEFCGSKLLDSYLGKPWPDWEGNFGATADYGPFSLNALFEFKYGNYHVQDLSGAFRNSNAVIGRNTPGAAEAVATMRDPNSTAEERLDAAIEWANEYRSLAPMSGMNNVHPADFLRWRELSLAYQVPGSFVQRLGFTNATVTVAGRNLVLWVNSEYTGMDPEINIIGRCGGGGIGCNFLTANEGWGVPLPRRYSVKVRLGF